MTMSDSAPIVLEKTKFLLVDDLPENLLALEALLHGQTVEIYKALSAPEALELLLLHDFALALVDVQMPEMNGFELAELMRGAEKTKNIPIIFVTAGAHSQRQTFKGYENGAVDFLYKPLDPHIVRSKANVFHELDIQKKLLSRQLVETQKALDKAEAAIKIREDFLSMASHELRTPITSLSLRLQLLARSYQNQGLKDFSAERLQKFFDVSLKQVKHLDRLIGSLLDVTKIVNGKLNLELENVDLAVVVREVVDQFSEQISANNIEVNFSLDENVSGQWDQQKISQITANLFANAIKYGAGRPIHLTVKKHGNKGCLIVQDHGIGIPKNDQDRLFKRFERLGSPNSVGGLGLGLHIVKEIAEAHGGNVLVESEIGEGSIFTVFLPLNFAGPNKENTPLKLMQSS